MQEYEFDCPDCGQHIEVNDPMRDAILTNGCPICSTAVTAEDFADG